MNESEDFLRKFHAGHAGATARACDISREGPSSYERLAEVVPHTERALTVLDLACGDGPLLAVLARRGQPKLSLIGVDMSPDELRLAEQRLGGRAKLLLERAQDLSLRDTAVDFVLSHLALMLMDPLEPVIAQIRRVLKPGGVLAAVVNGEFVRGDAYEGFVTLAKDAMQHEGKAPAIGDRRMYSIEGLRSLFDGKNGFELLVIEDFTLQLDGTVENVHERLMLTYYPSFLSPKGAETLHARTMEMLRSFRRNDGSVPCSLGLRLVRCVKRLA